MKVKQGCKGIIVKKKKKKKKKKILGNMNKDYERELILETCLF